MGRRDTTREFDETYAFNRFALNQGVPAAALGRGEFSKLAGVDGRFRGAPRVFPGFTTLTWPFSLLDLVLFRGFEVQKGNSDTVIRGFLVLYDFDGGPTYKLELKYYDGSWKTYTINSDFKGSQNDVDIIVTGKLIIVTGARAQTITKSSVASSANVTFSGTYTGPGNVVNYDVVVTAGPSPDTFTAKYQQKTIFTAENVVAAQAFLLGDGISVTFASADSTAVSVRAVVRAKGASTIFWDDDAADFTQEPSGSLFNDYPDGIVDTPWGDGSTSVPEVQIPPGVLGFLSQNRFEHDQDQEDSRLEIGASDAEDTGKRGFLRSDDNQLYGIAWRLRDTRRNLYTPISIIPYGELDVVRSSGLLLVHIPATTWVMFRKQTTWNRLEIFRTIIDGSVLYREWEIDLAAHTGTVSESLLDADSIFLVIGSDGGSSAFTDSDFLVQCSFTLDGGSSNLAIDTFPGTIQGPSGRTDNFLVTQDVAKYDFDRDSTLAMPPGLTRIGSLQGITVIQADGFATQATDLIEQRTNSSLMYSPLSTFRPEMFPATNLIHIPQRDGKVQQFQTAGDYIFAVTPNAMWRIQRSGSRLAANRVNIGWGIANKGAMVEANNELFIAMRRGLVQIAAGSADATLLVAVERTMLDDWRTELAAAPDTATPGTPPKIQTAFDAVLGAVFVLNRVLKECIILWTATGQITTLEDIPWNVVTSLPDPTSGGSMRAWFAKSSDTKLYRADPERAEAAGPTFVPFQPIVQGTATGGSTTSMTDTANVFTTEIIGHIIYVDTGSGYEKATITARSINAVNFTSLSDGGTVVSGNRYILAPIRFNVVAWPLPGATEDDKFHRRVIHGMWAQPNVIAGTPNAKARWTYEAYKQSSATPAQTVDANWDAAGDQPGKLPGYLPQGGTILRPGWLCIEPEMHYELLSGRVRGKVLSSDKVS